MRTYEVPLVPGPTSVPEAVRAAYQVDYGSGDLEPEFFDLYAETQEQLRQILGTRNQMAIMTGEGMVALWGALKSCLQPGDVVVAVGTGPFGYGIGKLAESTGATVYTVGFEYDEAADPEAIEAAIIEYRPKMVTAVHCETPCGTLNPIDAIGRLVVKHSVPLFYVDAVSSAGGTSLQVDEWGIDLCLVGSQKALSIPPDLAIVSVSERAWQVIEQVDYQGYDALKPWRTALADRWFPYTPSWHSIAALNVACKLLLDEGLENAIQRHADVARYCRRRVREMGLELFPRDEGFCAPTVTAVRVPEALGWEELDRRLRARGVVVGGSLEKLAGVVFRIGHMGSQAQMDVVRRGMDALEEAIAR
jgi:aspartate aminotransferase-like enzyme